jgi:hypothetical protein
MDVLRTGAPPQRAREELRPASDAAADRVAVFADADGDGDSGPLAVGS